MMPILFGNMFNLKFFIMAQSVFKLPLAHARLQRNAFDLSNSELLTQSLGQLLPVFVREVNPNEHIRIRPELYSRTQPLNTSAFVNIKQNIEFFFVPYRLLWSHAQTFFPKTDYGTSTLINSTAPRYAPNIKMKTINEFLKFCASHNVTDDLGYDFGSGSVRLLDLLGYGDFSSMNSSEANVGNSDTSPNVLRLLAYQKIYQDFYRNEVLEPQDMNSYNCDKLFQEQFNTGEIIPVIDQMSGVLVDKMKPIFKLRYRNLRSDYFTSARPSFNGASWMSTRVVAPSFTSLGAGNSGYTIPRRETSGQSGSFVGSIGGYTTLNDANNGYIANFSIANLRSAYALDKLYNNMAHAKDGCYAHQIEARFGVSPNLDDYHCRYIGGSEAPVQIGEVIGTSAENLGDIGGKGTSYNSGHDIEFDIKEHGVIMGVQSFLIMQDYAANGLDRMNAKTSFEDFLQPEFDELGFQPIYRYELQSPIDENALANNVFGYAPRYAEYKSCYNRLHGNFRKGKSLSSWASQADLINYSLGSGSISWEYLKCNPNLLDSIMTVEFDGTLDTDQIFSRNHFDCQIIRPISVYGSPYFG